MSEGPSSSEKKKKTPFQWRPERDIVLLKQVLADKPYAAVYGQVSAKWEVNFFFIYLNSLLKSK